MLFKDYHIPQIRSGSKTVTRREWADNYHGPNVGTVVAAKTDLLKPDDECDCFIRITDKREEYLGEITEASSRREGDYDGVEEFRDGYEEVYGEGSWDPDKAVTVVQFEYVGESRPGDDVAGEASTDGGQVLNETERREELAYGGVCPICGDEFTDGFERLKDLEGESIEGVRICVIDLPEENLFHLPDDQADHSGDTGGERSDE